MKKLLTLALISLAGAAYAQATPAGLWKTVDDETKKEKSLVRLVETGGTLTGKVEKLLDPARQDAKCEQCTDNRKDQPVTGMTILEGVKKNAEQPYWDGGTILDPSNGKSYKVRLTPKDDGKTMEVRGYVGMPMLGRTQVWTRVE